MVLEALSMMMDRASTREYARGSPAMVEGHGIVRISQLLFANDTLFFCDADMTQVKYFRYVLIWIQMVSGLKIKLRKCKIIQSER